MDIPPFPPIAAQELIASEGTAAAQPSIPADFASSTSDDGSVWDEIGDLKSQIRQLENNRNLPTFPGARELGNIIEEEIDGPRFIFAADKKDGTNLIHSKDIGSVMPEASRYY